MARPGEHSFRLPALVLLVSLLLFARRPDLILRPQFVWEEPSAFWAAAIVDWPALLTPWVGFPQLFPRLTYAAASVGPPAIAPAVIILAHWLLIAAVAVFLASDTMADAIPGRWTRFAIAVALPLLGSEVVGTGLDAQWYLAVLLVALALARPRRWHVLAAIVAGLSGPASIVLWPLFWRRPGLGAVVACCGAIQLAVFLSSPRPPSPVDLSSVPGMLIPVAAIAILAAWRSSVPRRTIIAFGWAAAATAAGGALTLGPAFGRSGILGLALGDGSRYMLVAEVGLLVLVAAGIAARRRPAVVAGGLIVALSIIGFRQPPWPDMAWASHADCIGSATTCVVPVFPAEWSVEWFPGYRPPTTVPG
ncbi:MAG TPA: hypothetical protein VFY18_15485 [Candidatus Limnocylindrales bacterium]|nr:hypothetical protein [Candidatus Limnocylindrales bacterium]